MGSWLVPAFFFAVAMVCLPFWPYSHGWTVLPTAFCLLIAFVTLLVGLFGKKGSSIWKHKGQG